MAAHRDLFDTLTMLIEACQDAERGFRTAADTVGDPAVKRLFATYARERSQFAEELTRETERLGGHADRGGSVPGALHRGWMNLRAAIAGRDEAAVIAEAERGEDVAVPAYEDALKVASLPADVRSVVSRQCAQVRDAHDRLRDLKRAA